METAQVPAVVSVGLIVVSAIFPVLSCAALVFRYMARRTARMRLQADDWWILISWITALGLSINVWVFGSITGIGHYKIDPTIGIPRSLQCLLVSSLILQVSLSVVKISILFLYKRIFTTPRFQLFAWIAIYVMGAWGILYFFLVLFEGDPISAAWTGVGRFRYDTVAIGVSQVGTSIALDFIVLMFPLPVIWTLHMPTRRKIAVALIFWLGALQLLCRSHRSTSSTEIVSFQGSHRRGHGLQFIFMILEPNCSIIAACLPCYGPLFGRGRAPDSLIRSLRSVFTLRSQSSGSGSPQQRSFASPTGTNGSFGKYSPNCTRETISTRELTESYRNNVAYWSSMDYDKHHTITVGVGRVSRPEMEVEVEVEVEDVGLRTQGIQVTTKVDVSSK
ncbi:hypothetical protein BDV10DRAFT_184014 [Aspergillus recurvatus]